MKKLVIFRISLAIFLTPFSGCKQKEDQTELIIFAAASLTETLTELGNRYMADHPEMKIIFNFDSSGTLKTQIQEGATCDIFISAGQKQMDQLVDAILSESRCNLLENKVALVVPEGNPAGIFSYDDLHYALSEGSILFAMGNSDVPVGQYTQKILEYLGLSEEALAEGGYITYGSNVKEVTTQIREAVVDCGIIYATDAYSAGLHIVDTATAEMCGQVIYPAAITKTSQNQSEAEAFMSYLRSADAIEVFSSVGFTPVSS